MSEDKKAGVFFTISNLFFLFSFLSMPFYGFSQFSGLVINEFLASNVSSTKNPFNHEFSDWIEIYNAGSSAVDIRGFYLTDDPDEPSKWEITFDKTIEPGGFIVFWADDLNEFVHTNFKLSRSGEFIGLYDHEENLIDSIYFGFQHDDISYGRIPGNLEEWAYFETVTPGESNAQNYYAGKADDPEFSIKGGFYTGSQTVTVYSSSPEVNVYFTLDGSPPDRSDSLYTSPLKIDSTTALRVRAYQNGQLPGDIVTQTYFIDEEVNLPFVSLTTDPKNFFDDSVGIYVIGTNGVPGYCSDKPMNVNRDWERPVNVELYDVNGRVELNQRAGVKIFGGCSRTRYPLKSLALYARGDYGKGSFDCQLFKDKSIYSFESFILRASGDDVVHTMMKDGMGQTLVEEMDIDRQAYRPAVVFINGEYWGIHNIREKINEHFVAGNYNIDDDEVNLIKGNPERSYNIMHGSAIDYNHMIHNIRRLDITDDKVYQYVTTEMDINNYLDYQIAEIYLSANDWPMNNIKYWKSNSEPYDKWRWIIYDLDNCFIYIERNTLDLATDPWCDCTWPNPPWSTFLFRSLLKNETFRDQFIQRYAWHMNTTFQPERVNRIIDSIKAIIEPEIPRHIERWGGKMVPDPESWIRPLFETKEKWEENIERMKYFIDHRRRHAEEHVMEYFDLAGDMVKVSVNTENGNAGLIKINSQTVKGSEHIGTYFPGIPMKIKAISSIGFEFDFWERRGQISGKQRIYDQEIEFTPEENIEFEAYFRETADIGPEIVINEINYHSADDPDPGDWVELYNMKNEIVDLSGWVFMDEDPDHVFEFPAGLEIGPQGYLVVSEDLEAFHKTFAHIQNSIGNTGFGFNNGGEMLRLYGPSGELVDFVIYDDEAPWPEEADGKGASLELIDPEADNNLAGSWLASVEHGTPGKQNFSNSIEQHILYQNYPNPFSHSTTIPFTLSKPGFVMIKIRDSMGREIASLVNDHKEAALYEVRWNSDEWPTGIYFCTMLLNNEIINSKRMVIIH